MTSPQPPTPQPPGPVPDTSSSSARYALGLLLVVYIFNFIDRQILSILLEPIKADIHLSDTQLGFLGGIAFALFYTVAGIPIARWADVGSRRTIIALALVIWSGMTAFTGMARGFTTLIIARVGVGIGEAGCSPPAHSLISDYFPPERRGTALAIYSLGIPIGGALGALIGGWVAELFDWRTAFMVVGLPGVFLAIIVRFTLPEPERGQSEPEASRAAAPVAPSESAGDVIRFMLRLRSFRHLAMAGALHAFVGYGAALFIPSFFIRIHGMSLGEVSTWIFALGLVGAVGTYLGGWLGDYLSPRDMRWYLWVPGLATLAGVPLALAFYTVGDPYVALMIAVPQAIAGPIYLGPTFAMTQGLVKPHMRAMASAVLLFILNLIGLGLGPQFVGILSDALIPTFGSESLRYALLFVVVIGNLWAALHYALGARTLRHDLTIKDVPVR
jgi:predicted MFS family arabinose efflux permease